MPRPRSLRHNDIASAALSVLDTGGLAALSMRAVAAELGMGTMSLYRYVDDRAQLEGLVVAEILGAVELDLPAHASWRRQVTVLLERVREAARTHPAVVPLLLTRRHAVDASVQWIEVMLGVLAGAGFAGRQRVIAQRSLVSYLVGALQLEHYGPLDGHSTTELAALDAADHPLLAESARHAGQLSSDEEFRRGLEVVLRGLEARRG